MVTTKTPASQHKISLCGSQVHYWTYNDNQPQTILMLHGFSGNNRGLAKIIDELGEYRLIVPDLPGFGDSTPMTVYRHTVAGYGHFLQHFIKALHLPQPPILLGHSLGTVVAARVAATGPQLIDNHLILISPVSSSPFHTISARNLAARIGEAHYWIGRSVPKIGPRVVTSKTISRATSFLLTKTRDKELRREIYNHHLSDLTFLRHRDVFYEAYRSLNRDGITNYAPEIHKQTLLIAGAADSVWPWQTQVLLKERFVHARLILIPKVGHLTHFESPDFIASEVKKFLK